MDLRQSTASQEISLGQFLDSTDGDTEENGLTIANTDIKIRKHGTTTLANKNSGGATNISNAVYHATLDATDTNTAGMLEIYVHVAGALAVKAVFNVLTATAFDAKYTGTYNNVAATDIVSAGAITTSSGAVSSVTTVTTTTTNTDMRGTDSAATAANLAIVDTNVDAILVDTGTTIPGQITGLNDFNPATDTVANVTTVATTTTNTDMRGTDSALLAVNVPTNFSDMSITATTGLVDITQTAADKAWLTSTRVLTAGTNIALAKGVGLTGLNDITAASVLAAGDIDGFSLEESHKLILAASTGILAGAATTTVTIQAADGSKARLTATVDADGNRSAVIKDATG